MQTLLTLIFGVFLGGCGYLITNFWFTPILCYLRLKHDIISNLTLFGNAINPENVCETLKQHYENRIETNRKNAAEFAACYYRLPLWFRWYLKIVHEKPLTASKNLIGLSNCSKEENAEAHINNIKRALRISNDLDI